MFTKKSEIAFIGAGKIAYSLCSAFLKTGYNVTTIISRKKSSAEKLAKKFRIPFNSDKLRSLSKGIKIFILTVSDDEIEITAKALSKLNLNFSSSLFIHVSGALNISELRSLKKKKAHTGSFHVMLGFPSKEIVEIENCPVAIESEEKVSKDFLNKLTSDLKLKPFYLKSDKKIYYHLAGVFASNFLAGNLFASENLFKIMKSGKKDFFPVFEATINSTLKNIKNSGPAKALSGPIERGDYETIENHLKALKKKDKTLYMSYVIQSLKLLELVKKKNGKVIPGHKKIGKLLLKSLRSSA